MATTWSYTRMSKHGMAQATLKASTGFNPASMLIIQATGPVTSLSDGSAIASLGTDLAAECYGGVILGRNLTSEIDYSFDVIPSATFSTTALLIKAVRKSTGALLTADTDLSGETLTIMLYGSDS